MMLTHAYLHNLLTAKITAQPARLIFATTGGSGSGTGGTAGGGPEKDDDEEEKKKESAKKGKEEEEKDKEKKKKEGEKKEKEKRDLTESEKEDEDDIDTTKDRIAQMAASASEGVEKYEQQLRHTTPKEKQQQNAEKTKQIGSELAGFNNEWNSLEKPTKDHIAKLLIAKKITKKQATRLQGLDPTKPDFDENFQKVAATIPALKNNSPDAKKLLDLKHVEGEKIQILAKKIEDNMQKFRELANEKGAHLNAQAYQERAKERLARSVGLNLEPDGTRLVYEDIHSKDKKKHTVKIKRIEFEDEELKDADGKVIGKVPGSRPKIVVATMHAGSNKEVEEEFTEKAFTQLAEDSDLMEEIQTMDELKKSIGHEVKKGAIFEYVENAANSKGEYVPMDKKIEIKDINANTNTIFLSETVNTPKGPKKELSLSEFSKWFKQKETVPQIETIEKLRQELYTWREKLNLKQKRNPADYPAIELKKDELLYYDDDRGIDFVIKNVNEKDKTILVGGDENPKSYAAFLRWVKREHVEKRSPDSEAAKKSALINDPEEKAAKHEAEKAKAEKDMKDRINKSENPPEGFVEYKTSEHTHPPAGYLRQLWSDTKFLSCDDLFEIGKTIWELIKRRWTRKQKERVGMTGQWMFGGMSKQLGAEFKSLEQSAENEEVDHHVKVMETQGIDTVKHELHHPPDKDTFKAAITVMCKKGYMRWDDEHFWHALEELSGQTITKENHLEEIKKILDKWWGDNTFNEFKNSQTSSYNSTMKNFEDDAKRCENDPKGPKGKLQEMLYNFIHGEPVHPCEYEAFLRYTFEAGKMAFEDKMFFLIMGIAARNPDGETLLHIDRIAAMEGDLLAKVPIMDFFVSPWLQQYDENGEPLTEKNPKTGEWEPKTGKPDVNTFNYWAKNYIIPEIAGGDIMKATKPDQIYWQKAPGAPSVFSDFVRDTIAWDEYARVRMEKASRNPENWDHDDMDMFIHLLNESSVEQCLRFSGGARMQVSFTGLKNSFAGLNEFIKRKIDLLEKDANEGKDEEAEKHYKHIMQMLKCFIRFDAIVTTRYDHLNNQGKIRFGDDILNSEPLCSADPAKPTVLDFMTDVRNLIGTVSGRLGLEKEWTGVMEPISPDKEAECKKQGALVKTYGSNLNAKFDEMKKTQGLKKVAQMLAENNKLRGLKKSTLRDQKESLKQETAATSGMTAKEGSDGEAGGLGGLGGLGGEDFE